MSDHDKVLFLIRYLLEDPDVDRDVCLGRMGSKECPFWKPPYGQDLEICVPCVYRAFFEE